MLKFIYLLLFLWIMFNGKYNSQRQTLRINYWGHRRGSYPSGTVEAVYSSSFFINRPHCLSIWITSPLYETKCFFFQTLMERYSPRTHFWKALSLFCNCRSQFIAHIISQFLMHLSNFSLGTFKGKRVLLKLFPSV